MTEAQRAYLSDIENVTFGNTNRVLDDLPDAPIIWAGKSLNLESKVALKFVFNMGAYEGKLSDLSLRIAYTDAYGIEKTETLTGPEPYGQGTGAYVFTVDTLLAAELRTVVSVQICRFIRRERFCAVPLYAPSSPVRISIYRADRRHGRGQGFSLRRSCRVATDVV